ncbi:UNVERIFIED_CONTAM: DNA damage-inducible protein 1, partial [Siphonaria sp. JEL0065]
MILILHLDGHKPATITVYPQMTVHVLKSTCMSHFHMIPNTTAATVSLYFEGVELVNPSLRNLTSQGTSSVEGIRMNLVENPELLKQAVQRRPELAEAVKCPIAFREVLVAISKTNGGGLAAPDLEIARRQKIEENRLLAARHHPEMNQHVSMLYIDMQVNGVEVKAFVDSGAQVTIMSPFCAKKCRLLELVDEQFAGCVEGVGKAMSLGKLHYSPIQIGSKEFSCSFTVMEVNQVSAASATLINPLPGAIHVVDISPDMSVEDLKALAEVEVNIPSQNIAIIHNGREIVSGSLQTAGVVQDDIMLVARKGPSNSNSNANDEVERIRHQLLNDAATLARVSQQHPELRTAVNNPDEFRRVLADVNRLQRDAEQRRRDEELYLQNADPFDLEAQRKIEDQI